ncbi:hypothetical protein HMPREF0262_03289 [Clostridium sp. ATCC 29733]|nr:hypothetical protein HMPREF0262_03289 [Clostridium sp. ATCC 29733]
MPRPAGQAAESQTVGLQGAERRARSFFRVNRKDEKGGFFRGK